jgi:branched-chain amino acid transport system permease protein
MNANEKSPGMNISWRSIKTAAFLAIILVIIFAVVPLFVSSSYWLHVLIMIFIYSIIAVSMRFIVISGQFPMAHAAFMGIGAYCSAVVAKDLGWSLWITIPLGALVAMGIGIFIGFPFARLRALYYAMVSLFFGVGILQVNYVFADWTAGYSGLTGIPPLLPAAGSKVPYYYCILAITLICLIALYRFEFSRIGTNLKAISQSYQVASSVGINEARYRVLALAVGCFFAGLAGAIYAHYNLTLSHTSFDMLATLWLFLYLMVGGMGSYAGPIIGVIVLMLIPELLRGLKQFVPFVSAAILFLVVYLMPQGLVNLPQRIRLRWFKRKVEDQGAVRAA